MASNSLNFELFRESAPVLAELGGFAERYVHSDPASALVKLRSLAELIAQAIYTDLRLEPPDEREFVRRLTFRAFREAVPEAVCAKLHAIRKQGNKAAHGGTVKASEALWILKEAHAVSVWYGIRCREIPVDEIAEFRTPADSTAELQQLRADKDKAEADLNAALEALEKVKVEYESQALSTEDRQRGRQVADALSFDEATTRARLIDVALADAGWDVNDTASVKVELEVQGQPTPSGIGYADYVLFDDNGKPLAVIEAKRTAQSEERGRKQASLYADALEQAYGQRPVVFYTNGYNIWIWDDEQGYPPRPLFGFYSKSSLQTLVNFQRDQKQLLNTLSPKTEIVERIYQLEAIKRVCETFTGKRRRALIVQATGTGKTRVAIALSELLIRAKWAKRILFLCDRKELVKQAKNAFNDFTHDPLTEVTRHTVNDTKSRIFVGTYPAMMNIFQTFDVGFFDLIIADESHRSIYNRYRDLFRYFDSLQIGLTATPVEFISRNTFGLFGCENQDPTAFYSLEDAVTDGYLVPYEVYTHTTKFLREGIKYENLTREQIEQLEEDGEDAEALNHEAQSIDRQIHNKDTNRLIVRNLMENGIRDESGQLPGKSIVFARNHRHAVLLQNLFDELYPQYGGRFCQVIDNYDPRAEQLIDDFKGQGTNHDLTIAISVDMLDTGIDVPEIVNLVFAKPVRSKVKFWQMIGRGTRLCPGLFGPGRDKTVFRIFDHWGNFEYFEQNKPEAEPSRSYSLMQGLFIARLDLASAALTAADLDTFTQTIALIEQDVASLPEETISVREKWGEIQTVRQDGVIEKFSPATVKLLRSEIGPLTQWINIRGHRDAHEFDLLVTQLQISLLKETTAFDDLKGEVLNRVNRLRKNLNPVKAKVDTIKRVRTATFWDDVTCVDLEDIRQELRSVMQYMETVTNDPVLPQTVDIAESIEEIETGRRATGVAPIDLAAYRKRVEETLRDLFDKNPTLQRIRSGEAVSERDLDALVSMVLTENPDVDLSLLKEFYPELAENLDAILRGIVGMDETAVRDRFQDFVARHPSLTAKQTHFLKLLQSVIAQTGSIAMEKLVDAPFTRIHEDGLHGVFPDPSDQEELLDIVRSFNIMSPDTTKTEATS